MAWPQELTADFTYIRFHGSGQRYGGYPGQMLHEWSHRIGQWKQNLKQIFVYFNNDIGGHAIHNARTLRAMLGQSSGSSERNYVESSTAA